MEERITRVSFLRRNIYFIYCILQVGGILNRMLRNVDNTHLPIENRNYDISSIHVQQWLFKAYNEIKILIFQPLLKILFLSRKLVCEWLLLPKKHSYRFENLVMKDWNQQYIQFKNIMYLNIIDKIGWKQCREKLRKIYIV